ncbi:precorrin-3B C(17)-methyltransferase [Lachnospiraceae bacterium LCP25S3_G4]
MGKIYVVGIGPGAYEQMTIQAAKALESCQVIIGYTVYVDLVQAHFPGKIFLTTPMKKEVERCRIAFEEAKKGRDVAMICSGDSGIYGMAGLMYEIGMEDQEIEIEVIAGVTAASAGAAVLGAPLIHDFALISLSDLLTPWEKIEQRLRLAAEADFVICLYNPSSRKRHDYLKKACDIILECKAPDTACGIVRNIGRKGEAYQVVKLQVLREMEVDMFTTVFVGNEQTKMIGYGNQEKIVTPRGYKNV